jgi:hypothetical protein
MYGVKGKIGPMLSYVSGMPWKHTGSGDVAPPFLKSALDGNEWSALCSLSTLTGPCYRNCPW